MAGIGPPIPVVDALIGRLIFVWPLLARNLGDSGDAQRHFTDSRLEDPLRPDEWDAPPIEFETLC